MFHQIVPNVFLNFNLVASVTFSDCTSDPDLTSCQVLFQNDNEAEMYALNDAQVAALRARLDGYAPPRDLAKITDAMKALAAVA